MVRCHAHPQRVFSTPFCFLPHLACHPRSPSAMTQPGLSDNPRDNLATIWDSCPPSGLLPPLCIHSRRSPNVHSTHGDFTPRRAHMSGAPSRHGCSCAWRATCGLSTRASWPTEGAPLLHPPERNSRSSRHSAGVGVLGPSLQGPHRATHLHTTCAALDLL
jgi:hypothetical protein